MINQVMFFVGLTIFVVYVYFLLRIIGKQHRIQRKEHANAYDQVDLDGMGNQGRIPAQKPRLNHSSEKRMPKVAKRYPFFSIAILPSKTGSLAGFVWFK